MRARGRAQRAFLWDSLEEGDVVLLLLLLLRMGMK
jgi:hypothetical protein